MDRWNLSVAAPLLMKEFAGPRRASGSCSRCSSGASRSRTCRAAGSPIALEAGASSASGPLGWTLATAATPVASGFGGLARAAWPSASARDEHAVHIEPRRAVVSARGAHAGDGRQFSRYPCGDARRACTLGLDRRDVGLARRLLCVRGRSARLGRALVRLASAGAGGRAERIADVPWGALLRERPVRALLATTFVTNWTAWFMYSWMPTYLIPGARLLPQGQAASRRRCRTSRWSSRGSSRVGSRTGSSCRERRSRACAAGFSFRDSRGRQPSCSRSPTSRRRTGRSPVSPVPCLPSRSGASTVLVNSIDLAPRHAGVLVACRARPGTSRACLSPFLGGAIVTRTGRWDLNFYVIAACSPSRFRLDALVSARRSLRLRVDRQLHVAHATRPTCTVRGASPLFFLTQGLPTTVSAPPRGPRANLLTCNKLVKPPAALQR